MDKLDSWIKGTSLLDKISYWRQEFLLFCHDMYKKGYDYPILHIFYLFYTLYLNKYNTNVIIKLLYKINKTNVKK